MGSRVTPPSWRLTGPAGGRVYAVTALTPDPRPRSGSPRLGSHSLRYFSAAVASPELAEPRFLSVGYVDDQLFVRFDSARASPRMEPRAAWMERMDREEPGYWERSTRRSEANAQVSRAGLRHLRRYFNQSEAGVHILQAMSCCEVSPELTFRRGFLQFAYDGRDYPALDTETSTWTAAVPQAVNSKRKWEAERSISEGDKAYLEETSVLWLKKYLEMGKETLQRAGTPMTRHTAPHGEVTLRCRAQDFYPADISLTWLRDGEEQLQDTEFIETRPSGDGTFQKWAGVDVTSVQEKKYTCLVQHEGESQAPEGSGLSLPFSISEPEPFSPWFIVGVIAVLLLLITVIARVVIWRKKKSGGQDCNDSAQGSDVSLLAKDETLGGAKHRGRYVRGWIEGWMGGEAGPSE
uniref:Ig-like domain-containing protein n=1 Tax=Vombatus ursinus TaxID=29139 RepID=A0A4X2JZB0_VOMUR